MPKTKDVELLEPFDHHEKNVTKITLKEPSGGLFADLGEPRILVRTGQGGYFVEQPQVIRQYLDKCVTGELGAEVMKLLSLADVIRLKAALFGFFADAEARIFEIEQKTSSLA